MGRDRQKRKPGGDEEPRSNAAALETVSGYRLEAVLGEGGFGLVHRARAPDGRAVAFKRLHDAGADPDELAFEFRVLHRLRHPHIVPVLDFGFADGRPYLVSAWVDGTDLRRFSQAKPFPTICRTLAGVLRALEHLHARGVLHRDLKPANVIVDASGHAYLIDFGLAGLVGRDTGRSGTPAYTPPERLLGWPEDGRADLYAFGVILHEVCHGDLPQAGSGAVPARVEAAGEAARAAARAAGEARAGPGPGASGADDGAAAPVRPPTDHPADPLIGRLLAPNPADRPATANEVIAALSALAGVPLEEERGAPEGPAPTAPGLVGREAALARFRRLLAVGRHRVLRLEGPAGAGKSHLLRAFAAEGAVARARVVAGRSLAEWVGQVQDGAGPAGAAGAASAPGARTAPGAAGAPLDAAEALLAEARVRQVVALIDDAHEQSPVELEALLGLAARLDVAPRPGPRRGLTVVVAYRGDEVEPRGLAPLFERLSALGGAGVLRVGAIPQDATAALATELLGRHDIPAEVLAEAHARARGLPGPLGDLLVALRRTGALAWRDGRWGLAGEGPIAWPRSGREALAARLAELPAPLVDLCRWLAAAGPLTLAELRRLAPEAASPEALERLAEEQVVAHVRAAGAARRHALASGVATALAPDPGAPRRHDALARLFAGDPARWLEHAARGTARPAAKRAIDAAEALVGTDPVRARTLLEALARGGGLAGAGDRARAVIALAEAELALDLRGAARARLDALAADRAPPSELEARWLAARARALGEGDPALGPVLERIGVELASPGGLGYADAALAAAQALEPVGPAERKAARTLVESVLAAASSARGQELLRGRALLARAALAEVAGEREPARRDLDEARRLVERDPRLRLDCARRLAFLHTAPDDLARGLALADEAVALAEALGDHHELGRALIARGYLTVHGGDLRLGHRLYRRARRHLAGRGPVADSLRALAAAAYLALKLGRPREAERHARRTLRLAVGADHQLSRLRARTNLAFARIRLGREGAGALADEALGEAERRGLADVAVAARYLAALDRVERGALAEAERQLAGPLAADAFHVRLLRVDLALLTGEHEPALAEVDALEPDAPFPRAKLEVRRAMLALARGDRGGAETAIAAARASGGHREDRFLAIELELVAAGVAAAAAADRQRAEAVARLDEVERLLVRPDMPCFEARWLVARERAGGAGRERGERLEALAAALERTERLGLWRDAHDLAAVLAARLDAGPAGGEAGAGAAGGGAGAAGGAAPGVGAPASAGAEAAAVRARGARAREAMVEGLPPGVRQRRREALSARARALAESLPPEQGLDFPAHAAGRLLQVYRGLARETDPEAVLPRVLDAAASLTGAARAFVLVRQRRRMRVVLGRGARPGLAEPGEPSRTIAEAALDSGQPVRLAHAARLDRYAGQASVREVGVGGALAVPFRLAVRSEFDWGAPPGKEPAARLAGAGPGAARPGEPSVRGERSLGGSTADGVIYLDDGGAGRAFSAEDEAIVRALADQAALALALAEAMREAARRHGDHARELARLRAELSHTTQHLESMRSVLATSLARIEARFEGMIGRSEAMRRVFGLVTRFAGTDMPVLITGETGTGKELCARALHARSDRRERPFLAINCGAIPPGLLESELFGHEAGAFTGADRQKPGLFEQADGGTVFLDEIGEMPVEMQAALLRVLESGEVRRVGGSDAARVDVRIVCATHRDLRGMVEGGAFREDLWFRLHVVAIHLPALRERLEDLPLLAEHILAELAESLALGDGRAPELSLSARRKLLAHTWPGNVRELRNVLARALVICSGERVGAGAIEIDLPSTRVRAKAPRDTLDIIDFQVAKERWIKAFLEEAMRKTGGNVTKAAELTSMKRQAMSRLLRNHGLDSAAYRRGPEGAEEG